MEASGCYADDNATNTNYPGISLEGVGETAKNPLGLPVSDLQN
jgi:hypothetical protein